MYTAWNRKDAIEALRQLNNKDGMSPYVAVSLEMGAKALENYKFLEDTILKLNDELQKFKDAYKCICEIHKQDKFELLKLIERNQLAWNNSLDKSYNLLPEVYLSNKHVLEKVGDRIDKNKL